jgi:hypothetical protein|tara:strand:+ start:176 stop:304 length:129 start_codon:yes stop_codon:yes gene_type:complete
MIILSFDLIYTINRVEIGKRIGGGEERLWGGDGAESIEPFLL